MAEFEGNYEIHFYVDGLSDERKKRFIEFIKRWRQEHTFECDNWINNLDYDTFESVLWGGNDPDNIKDLHDFLSEAAKAFPELEAKGDGDGEDVGSGEWATKYRFSLQGGALDWDEDEWTPEKEAKKQKANGSKKKNFKHSLKEIFPDLDESLPHGLIVKNGVLEEIDYGYSEYLGVDDYYEKFYCPPEVERFDDNFDAFMECYECVITDFVITTNFKEIPQGFHNSFEIQGIENFYIIDAETKETVFFRQIHNVSLH